MVVEQWSKVIERKEEEEEEVYELMIKKNTKETKNE